MNSATIRIRLQCKDITIILQDAEFIENDNFIVKFIENDKFVVKSIENLSFYNKFIILNKFCNV